MKKILLIAALALPLAGITHALAGVDVVLYPSDVTAVAGLWTRASSTTGAGGQKMTTPDTGWESRAVPLAAPAHYFEMNFNAPAGQSYHVWLRLRGAASSKWNESVWVQFSDGVADGGAPLWRIGSTSALLVNLEDCIGCGISGWGWQDNASWTGDPARIAFAASGTHTIRVQLREDGVDVDQVVLSPVRWFSSAPGSVRDDTTIVEKTGDGGGAVTLVRQPYLQQVTDSSAVVAWATREPGPAEVRYQAANGAAGVAPAATRLVSSAVTGMPSAYYQHEAELTGLTAATSYAYRLVVGGVDAGSLDRLTTAPPRGSGTVRFLAFGDSGIGSTEQRQLATRMTAETFDFALHTGDVTYGSANTTGAGGYPQLQSWFFDIYKDWLRSRPVFPSIGNHDDEANQAAPYRDVFVLPRNGASSTYPDHAERYYSFDYGPAHFVVLDTELAFQDPARRREQIAWLTDDLLRTSQPWKIAVFHRPPFSAGGEHQSDLTVRAELVPIFEQYGVSLVLNGHEHDYERTIPWQETAGGHPVTYIVTGGGGARLYPAAFGPWTAASRSVFHYLRGSISTCTITIDAVALDASVFDRTTLDRCTTPGPAAPEVVIHAADIAERSGWSQAADASAADGVKLTTTDTGWATLERPLASPANYLEASFDAPAGVPYRIWLRLRATGDTKWSESTWVQFSDSVTSGGDATYRSGTTNALLVNLENCYGCGVSGWGWQGGAYWLADTGVVRFATAGSHTIRVQVREDGVQLDQIVLSPAAYLTARPGGVTRDATVVPRP